MESSKSLVSLKIPLTLEKKISNLDKTSFVELIDLNCLISLVESKLYDANLNPKNYSQYFSSQKYKNIDDQLKNYIKKCYDKKTNMFNVEYIKPKHKWGRVFPTKSLGLTSFPKKIRNTLIKDTYIDIDITNAQPVILYNICISNDILCPILTQYINNRENILIDVMECFKVSRNDAKTLFLRLSFFGSVDAWCDDLKIKNNKCDFVSDYIKELNNIANDIKNKNKDLYDTARKQKTTNIIGSFFSLYLQEYETRIMECAINWLNNHTQITTYKNMKVLTYEFDGLKLLKKNVEEYGLSKLLRKLNKVIKESIGFDITFEEKPITEFYEIKYEPYEVKENKKIESSEEDIKNGVWNDSEASKKMFSLYPHWKYCLDILYIFDFETGLWSNSKATQRCIIQKFTNDLRILTTDLQGNIVLTKNSYGSTLSKIDVIIEMIKSECQDNQWLERNENSSLGMLLFNNGYLDLKNGFKFYDKETCSFNPDIVFMERIFKDFKPFDEDQMGYMETIKKRFFYDTLGENLGDYYILQLARGLMGDLMKKIIFGLGTTNCGKSVLTQALKKSLGGYYGDFNAENLVYTKSSTDEAAKLRWALLLRYKRIIISNEMKTNTLINGNMLKKISSGGDGITGRFHQGNETSFTPHGLFVCMANDIPKITPYDTAVDGRVRIISYKKQFVDEVEDNENELLKDNNIYDEINKDEFQSAFLMMLIKRYVEFKENGDIKEPDEVINGKKEWIEETGNIMDLFLNDFEITDNEEDFVPSEDINLWLTDKKLGISSTKAGIEIKKYCEKKKYDNVINKKKKVDKRSITVWFGIKAINN